MSGLYPDVRAADLPHIRSLLGAHAPKHLAARIRYYRLLRLARAEARRLRVQADALFAASERWRARFLAVREAAR